MEIKLYIYEYIQRIAAQIYYTCAFLNTDVCSNIHAAKVINGPGISKRTETKVSTTTQCSSLINGNLKSSLYELFKYHFNYAYSTHIGVYQVIRIYNVHAIDLSSIDILWFLVWYAILAHYYCNE